MHSSRIDILHKLLDEYNLTHILVNDPTTAAYITGFCSSNIYLLISRNHLYLFTDSRYQESAEEHCKQHPEWTFIKIEQNNFLFLKPFIDPGSRIGIQADMLTLSQYDTLKKALRGTFFVKIDKKIFISVSQVKLPHEIEAITTAATAADRALAQILPTLRDGITEIETSHMLDNYCKQAGSEKVPFDHIVLFGQRSSLNHGKPSDRKLSSGDFVLFDFGCVIRNFCCDMTRTYIFGSANQKQKEIYSIVLSAQEAVRNQIRPGMCAKNVDAIARTIITNSGYGEAFGHSLGHGVGRLVHEYPRLSKLSDTILEPGMVVTIEPGIYIPGFGGVRIEDTILITANGCDSLTRSNRALIEL